MSLNWNLDLHSRPIVDFSMSVCTFISYSLLYGGRNNSRKVSHLFCNVFGTMRCSKRLTGERGVALGVALRPHSKRSIRPSGVFRCDASVFRSAKVPRSTALREPELVDGVLIRFVFKFHLPVTRLPAAGGARVAGSGPTAICIARRRNFRSQDARLCRQTGLLSTQISPQFRTWNIHLPTVQAFTVSALLQTEIFDAKINAANHFYFINLITNQK